MPDVLHDLALQIRGRREDAACHDVALDLGESELDLIQPRRLRGREVQLHTAMLGEERPHRLRPVGRELVENDVDLAPRRLRRGDVREERQKVGACVPRGGLPDHLGGLGVQRGVEREGAVPLVFEAVALRSAGRQREARVDAVERLNRRLFVETEYRGVLRPGLLRGKILRQQYGKVYES